MNNYIPKLAPAIGNGLGGIPDKSHSDNSSSVGDIVLSASNPNPGKYLLADGKVVSASDYPELFVSSRGDLVPFSQSGYASGLIQTNVYGTSTRFSPNGKFFVSSSGTSPFIAFFEVKDKALFRLQAIFDSGSVPVASGGGNFSPDSTYYAVGVTATPYIYIYKIVDSVFTKLSNPAALPSSQGIDAAWSPDGNVLYVGIALNGGNVVKYTRSGDVFTKEAFTTTSGSNAFSVAVSPDGLYLAVGTDSTVAVYRTSDKVKVHEATGFTFDSYVAWSPDSKYLASCFGAASNNIRLYKVVGGVFTTIISTGGSSSARKPTWTPDGRFLLYSFATAPFVRCYRVDPDDVFTFIGGETTTMNQSSTISCSPLTNQIITTGNVSPYIFDLDISDAGVVSHARNTSPWLASAELAWSHNGDFLAEGGTNAAPYLKIFKKNGDLFSNITGFTAPPGAVYGIDFSSLNYLAISHPFATPWVSVYKIVGDTFTKLANPSVLPSTQGTGTMRWSPDGTYLLVSQNASPYMVMYKLGSDILTSIAIPATTGYLNAGSWNPSGSILSLTLQNTPWVYAYSRSGDTFTAINISGTALASSAGEPAWSPDGTYFLVGINESPYIALYNVNGTTISRGSAPVSGADIPAGPVACIAFRPDGKTVVVGLAGGLSGDSHLYSANAGVMTKIPSGGVVLGTAFSASRTQIKWSKNGESLGIISGSYWNAASTLRVISRVLTGSPRTFAIPNLTSTAASVNSSFPSLTTKFPFIRMKK